MERKEMEVRLILGLHCKGRFKQSPLPLKLRVSAPCFVVEELSYLFLAIVKYVSQGKNTLLMKNVHFQNIIINSPY